MVRTALDAAEQSQLRIDSSFDRASFSGLNALTRRVPWDQFAELAESIDGACRAKPDGHAQFACSFFDHAHEMGAFASLLLDPLALFRMHLAMGTWAFLCVREKNETRGEKLLVQLELQQGFRDCEAFFRICRGTFEHALRSLGYGACPVRAELHPRGGRYEIRLPPARTLKKRGARALRPSCDEALAWLAAVQREFQDVWSEAARLGREGSSKSAAAEWRLTQREAAVLELLSRGLSNKEIASRLGCATRTVEIHVSRVLRKSGSSSRAELISNFFRMR